MIFIESRDAINYIRNRLDFSACSCCNTPCMFCTKNYYHFTIKGLKIDCYGGEGKGIENWKEIMINILREEEDIIVDNIIL